MLENIEEELNGAVTRLSQAISIETARGIDLAIAKTGLEMDIAVATFEGDVTGKNEQERKGCAYSLFTAQHSLVAELEAGYKELSSKTEIARLHLQYLRDLIRVAEIAKK